MEGRLTRFLFYSAGGRDKASSRVRAFWIAEELGRRGNPCSVYRRKGLTNLLRSVPLLLGRDVIVFQKTHSRYHRWLMGLARRSGKRAYYDIDDFPSRVHSPVTLSSSAAMMRMADGVFAGSGRLVDFSRQFTDRVHLVPSGIRLDDYPVRGSRPGKGEVCLGWIGNGLHYKQDLLQILVEPLSELGRRVPDLHLKLVGALGDRDLHEAFGNLPQLKVEIVDELDWAATGAVRESLEDFDVGLYPLLDNDYNAYKCGYKALEYMAIGIPVVSSPLPGNLEVISPGEDGLAAATTAEWIGALEALIGDEAKCRKMGEAGRRKVEAEYHVGRCAERILAAVEAA